MVCPPLLPPRYYVASDWTPKKMEVEVPMPDTLDLEHLRSSGQQPGEVLQPEEPAGGGGGGGGAQAAPAAAAAVPAAAPVPDEMVVATLSSAGFTENAAKRAGEGLGVEGSEIGQGQAPGPGVPRPPPTFHGRSCGDAVCVVMPCLLIISLSMNVLA